MKRSKIVAVLTMLMLSAAALAGCASEGGEPVSVQSVAMLAGIGNAGLADRFGGVVSARSEVKIKADQDKTVREIFVEEGDEVTKGQVLFSYDIELAELNLEKADLELQKMNNSLTAKQNEKATLEKQRAKAPASEQLSYTLEIAECDADIREQSYNIAAKEKEVARLKESIEVKDCVSPVEGRIKSINNENNNGSENGYMGGDADAAFITIIESGSYRVMGYVNENNAAQLTPDLEVIIRSRVDDRTWNGYVAEIDWTNPQSANNNGGMYYPAEETDMNTTNKYPFYVELLDSEGLLLGQHVYIEPAVEENEEDENAIILPMYYIVDLEGAPFVWAENASGKLEKREITVTPSDPEMGMYRIDSGLSAEDYIAFPEEDLQEGRPCQEFDDIVPQDNYEGMPADVMPEEGMMPDEGIPEEGMPIDEMPVDEMPEEEFSMDEMPFDEFESDMEASVEDESAQGGN